MGKKQVFSRAPGSTTQGNCISGKIYYWPKAKAKKAAKKMALKYKNKTAPYLCDHCGGYHLTTKSRADRLIYKKGPKDE